MTPVALVILGEQIRKDAVQTLKYFKDQGVTVKVISGDNLHTVAAIASAAGIAGAEFCLDDRNLSADPEAISAAVDKNNAFGRVTPEQKSL